MPYTIFNENWLAQNENRAYPMAEDALQEDVTGSFRLPTTLLLGLQLAVPALDTLDPARFFLKSVVLSASGMLLRVAYDDGDDHLLVGSAVVPFDGHEPRSSYAFSGVDDFDDVTGKVVVGRVDGLPAGQYDFAPEGGKLDPDVVRPHLRGVRELRVRNADDEEISLTGVVSLVAGSNVRFDVTGAGTDAPQVVVNAIDGEGLNQDCECEDDVGEPVRTINGVAPTAAGDFSVLGDAAIAIAAVTNGIQITNTVAKPCCGCEELEKITERMELFGTAKATLEGFAQRLEGQVSNAVTNLLGSKLNDVPCIEA